jgi:hypothetical protein
MEGKSESDVFGSEYLGQGNEWHYVTQNWRRE